MLHCQKREISILTSIRFLVGDEAHHAPRSLRIKQGEELLATDLAGTCYLCRVEQADSPTLTVH